MMDMLSAGGMPVMCEGEYPSQPGGNRHVQATPATGGARPQVPQQWLAAAEGKACKLDSQLLFNLPASHEYRVIFMQRELEEVLAAYAATEPRRGEDNNEPPEMLRRHFEQHLRRVDHWLNGPRLIAYQYCPYDETIAQPLVTARRVTAFLGLRLNTDAMAAAAYRAMPRRAVDIDPAPRVC